MFDQYIFLKKERILELITDEINIYDLFVDQSFRRDFSRKEGSSARHPSKCPQPDSFLGRLYITSILYKNLESARVTDHFILYYWVSKISFSSRSYLTVVDNDDEDDEKCLLKSILSSS